MELMNEKDWEIIENNGMFNRKENWGNPYKMSKEYIHLLHSFRANLGRTYIINCGYEEAGHATKSAHSFGGFAEATDGSIRDLSLVQEFTLACFFKDSKGNQFKGIGIYPNWTLRGKVMPGLHTDIKKRNCNRLFWIEHEKGKKYEYFIDEDLMYEVLCKIEKAITIY